MNCDPDDAVSLDGEFGAHVSSPEGGSTREDGNS